LAASEKGNGMRLWSFQQPAAWEAIKATGKYSVPESEVDEDFVPAYRWIIEKMTERIGPAPAGVTFPVWAWARREGQDGKRPDLRRNEYCSTGEAFVLLELEIPSERLLLSDANGWDSVLLGTFYLPQIQTDAAYDAESAMLDGLPQDERAAKIRKTWNGIFDVKNKYPNDSWWGRGMYVQATAWEFRKEDVVSVTTHIKGKAAVKELLKNCR
jgi:hypothetical protein